MLVAAAGGGTLLWLWFVGLERRGRRGAVLGVVLGVFLAEALLNTSAANVPPGIFRPSFAGQDFRAPDVVLLLAIAARAMTAKVPRRISGTALAWGAFLLWYSTAAVVGLLYGRQLDQILFEAKAVFYIGGAMALVAGTDVAALVRRRAAARWTVPLGVAAAGGIICGLTDTAFAVNLPGAPLDRVGSLNSDAATVLVAFGAVALVVELCRPHPRVSVGVAALAMILSPVGGEQRGSFLGLGVSAGAMLLVVVGQTWRRRARTTPTEAGLVLAGIGLAIGLGLVVAGPGVDVGQRLEDTFLGSGEERTADTRTDLRAEAIDVIRDRPFLGAGLGTRLTFFDVTTLEHRGASPHNVAVDVTLRSGLIGLALLTVALGMTSLDAVQVYRRHRDSRVAALALGCLVALAGILAKGMVESVFDKFRIAIAVGLLCGAIAASARSLAQGRPVEATGGDDGGGGSAPRPDEGPGDDLRLSRRASDRTRRRSVGVAPVPRYTPT